jgi:hypothetical protein
LILFLYIYAILGLNLFAQIKFSEGLDAHANFQTVGSAMLTLLRISTGENWHLIMAGITKAPSMEHECVETADYGDYKANGYQSVECGSKNIGIFFFVSFIMIV